MGREKDPSAKKSFLNRTWWSVIPSTGSENDFQLLNTEGKIID